MAAGAVVPWPGHYHLEWGGRRASGTTEIWQNGVRYAKPENDGETVPFGEETFDQTDTEEYVRDLMAFAVKKWFTTSAGRIHVACLLEWCSATWILPSGAADPAYTYRYTYPAPVPGGSAANIIFPYQCAIVVTWTSDDRSRGPGSRGRIYQPAPTPLLVASTGLMSTANALSVAQGAAVLVQDLRHGNLPTGDRRYPCIVSPLDGGKRSRIDHVTVDTRVDVLRKRGELQEASLVHQDIDHDWFDG